MKLKSLKNDSKNDYSNESFKSRSDLIQIYLIFKKKQVYKTI